MSAGTAGGNWTDLSGAELRSRLKNRGLSDEQVNLLVRGRDKRFAVKVISELLER